MWAKIKAFFYYSETIAWVRFQVLVGFIMSILTYIANDPNINYAIAEILDPKYVPFYLIGMGLFGEWMRKRNAVDL